MILAGKESIKKSIQEETQTKINVCLQTNSIGTKKRVVEIKGAAHYNVYSARQRIKSIVDDCQKRTRKQPTHFTCVKITDPKIQENFIKFKVSWGLYFLVRYPVFSSLLDLRKYINIFHRKIS